MVNMAIRSMGPVDDKTEAFNLDCYFRQSWLDDRLKLVILLVLQFSHSSTIDQLEFMKANPSKLDWLDHP